jgi:hypothetical protein
MVMKHIFLILMSYYTLHSFWDGGSKFIPLFCITFSLVILDSKQFFFIDMNWKL